MFDVLHMHQIKINFRTFSVLLLPALARERSLAIDVLVLPLDVTEYKLHKDLAQAVTNHFQRVIVKQIIIN